MFPMMDPESVSMYCEFLAFLPAKADVLEWGLGGSTLFFPKYVEGGTWTTIEHDVQWAAKLQSHIDANPSTFPYLSKSRFELVSRAGPLQPWTDGTLEEYRQYIEAPATLNRRFDVVVVDGRARVECAGSIVRNKLLRSADSYVFVVSAARSHQATDGATITALAPDLTTWLHKPFDHARTHASSAARLGKR